MSFVACPRCGRHRRRGDDCIDGCDPGGTGRAMAVALLLGLSPGCIDKDDDTAFVGEPEYGVPMDTALFADNDGDGFSEKEGDCADEDATRHPDAKEKKGDGVDSNCNGEDDT